LSLLTNEVHERCLATDAWGFRAAHAVAWEEMAADAVFNLILTVAGRKLASCNETKAATTSRAAKTRFGCGAFACLGATTTANACFHLRNEGQKEGESNDEEWTEVTCHSVGDPKFFSSFRLSYDWCVRGCEENLA